MAEIIVSQVAISPWLDAIAYRADTVAERELEKVF